LNDKGLGSEPPKRSKYRGNGWKPDSPTPHSLEADVSTRQAFAPDAILAATASQNRGPGTPSRETAQSAVQLVRDAEGAAFATDGSARIVAWNHAAEELLGHKIAAVRGKTFSDLVECRDLFGNRICCECGIREMIRRGEPVRRHLVVMTTASGEAKRVVLDVASAEDAVSSVPPLVYRLRPDSRQDRRAFDPSRFPGGHAATLTPAELKVLRILAAGKRAQDAANSLGVSLTTVRNHIQHIFHKLKVHNQGEAISLALRNGLV
jgi:PAS domain S-box-containing protein